MKVIKRLERYFSAAFSLGRIKSMSKDAQREIAELRLELGTLSQELKHTRQETERMWAWMRRHEALADDLVSVSRREAEVLKRTGQSDTALLLRMFSDLSRRIDGGESGRPEEKPPSSSGLPSPTGFEMFKDAFYHRFENQWRGAPEEISQRLKVYLPDVEAAWARAENKPIFDIGCGRGEWLGLLREHGMEGIGFDTNAVQIQEGQTAGLDLRLGDALEALAQAEDNSLSVISAHHLIEHLPFDSVAWLTREAGRVLAPGGLLLFETPNTRNVLVGATTFYTDPTHLKPMPEQVMGVLLETAGFEPVDIRHINPHERLGEFLDRPGFDNELAQLMFGPQDLAILGIKSKDK